MSLQEKADTSASGTNGGNLATPCLLLEFIKDIPKNEEFLVTRMFSGGDGA